MRARIAKLLHRLAFRIHTPEALTFTLSSTITTEYADLAQMDSVRVYEGNTLQGNIAIDANYVDRDLTRWRGPNTGR